MFEYDATVALSSREYCCLCLDPFKLPEQQDEEEEDADIHAPCDHLILDDTEECWICSGKPSPTFKGEEELVVRHIEPVGCRAIRLQPCGHILGDTCLDEWMSNPEIASHGLCPCCRQPLTRVPFSLLGQARRYLGKLWIFHVPDMILAILLPSFHPRMAKLVQPSLSMKIMAVLFPCTFLMAWTYGLSMCLRDLSHWDDTSTYRVWFSAYAYFLMFLPVIMSAFNDPMLWVSRSFADGLHMWVFWYLD